MKRKGIFVLFCFFLLCVVSCSQAVKIESPLSMNEKNTNKYLMPHGLTGGKFLGTIKDGHRGFFQLRFTAIDVQMWYGSGLVWHLTSNETYSFFGLFFCAFFPTQNSTYFEAVGWFFI